MTFTIATAAQDEAPATPCSFDGVVSYRNDAVKAERKHRQIISAIECCETAAEVEDTLIENDILLDALLLDWPDYFAAIGGAADSHKAILAHGHEPAADAGAPAPIPAIAQSNVLNKTF